ncbi:gram domain-containing protein [Lichtheimia corymbifera JMRC:FSU:9682]|uniref:Gram domain-containing protein n=1 Tax=Lichtheimia corymbifera JMRC:FSU:9682 TaxID=1263082 RepID=A0A068RZZ5_9FUNG|nr:gram domain-containing protein [Lichtheimia corymbifera JMRC:FSU:9682]
MSMRRRRHLFHSLFDSVPLDERLLQVYRCALQKDILVQGHMYVSEHHVCFKANIFGWITRIAIAFTDIEVIEKRNTARLIPNGIRIVSGREKHVFASFLSRDDAYQLLMDLWEEHHPQSDKKQKHDEDEEEDRASHVSTIATTTVPSKEAIRTTQQVLPTPPPSPAAISPSSSPPPSPPTTARKQRTTLFWPGRWRPMLALPPPSTPTEKAPIIQNNDNDNKDTTTEDNEATHGMGCLLTLTLVLIITHIYMIYHLVRASRHLAVIESFCK